MNRVFFLFSLWIFWLTSAWATIPVVEEVQGEKIIVIHGPQGNRVATQGDKVHFGESIKTGPRTTVKVRYPDGSKLLIGSATTMEVKAPQGDDIPRSEIHLGRVRALIKTKDAKRNFIFKTPSSVLGVRGTDFTFEAFEGTESRSAVHTLKGVVEVAEDEEILQTGQGLKLGAGEKVEATKKGLGSPEKFDRNQYLSELGKAQPSFANWMQSDSDLQAIEAGSSEKDMAFERLIYLPSFQVFTALVEPFGEEVGFYTLGVSWNPQVNLVRFLSLRFHFGLTLIEPTDINTALAEMAMLVSKTIGRRLVLEAGLGAAGVFHHTAPGYEWFLNVAWREDFWSVFNRVFIGYSYYNLKKPIDMPVWILRLGFGF